MENLPVYITVLFVLATVLTGWFLFNATGRSKNVLFIMIGWLILQAIIALTGFYKTTDTLPPRFALLVLPPLVMIAVLFLTIKGKIFIDSLSLRSLTLLHTVRILVELVLFLLCANHVVPRLITFEGMNFDIISGITAPIVYYFSLVKGLLNKKILLTWNILCLVLLLNVVVRAVLSVPTPFQQFSFNQPAIAVLYAPYNWLPCFIVPVVLFSHLAAIRRLSKTKNLNGFR